MQMGQTKFEMQTMNQSLCDLVTKKVIAFEEAVLRSSDPEELITMISAKELQMGASSRNPKDGRQPATSARPQQRNR